MDIAKLGFQVDSKGLDAAVSKLRQLTPAGKGAADAANRLSKAASSASATQARAALSAAQAEESKARAVFRAAQASSSASREEIKSAAANLRKASAATAAARAARDQAKANLDAAEAQMRMAKVTDVATNALKKQDAALAGVASGLSGIGGSGAGVPGGGRRIANDQLPNRFNTANIAAQFQDIGVTAAAGFNPLTIALQQGTQLSAIINQMENPLRGIGEAFKSIINPVSLLSIGLTALAVVGIQTVDWATVGRGALIGFANALDFVADNIEILTVSAAGLLTVLIALNWQSFTAGVLGFGAAIARLAVGMKAAAVAAVGFFTALTAPAAIALGAFVTLIAGVTAGLNGMFGEQVQQRIRQFFSFLKPVGDLLSDVADRIRSFAGEMTGSTNEVDKQAEAFDRLVQAKRQNLSLLQAEIAGFDLSARNARLLKMEVEDLNALEREGIQITRARMDELTRIREEYLKNETRLRNLNEAQDLLKDTSKGFFNDMRTNLRNGQSLWESFGNAVTNALDKIIDKFLEASFDMIFDNLNGGSSSGSGGGIIGGIADFLFNANGNAFNRSGVQPFANGGAFTNSVVNSPTMFAFANGGALGVMGEAGPEAIMPLHRGSDGSLGVRLEGGMSGGGANININIINNSNASARTESRETNSGTQIDVIIDEIVAQKIGSQGSASDVALQERNNRQLIRRR